MPDYGSRLTIRHLVTHTSGLRDVFLLRGLAAPRDEGGDQNDAIVKLLTRQRALNFTPGTEYQYSNGGYAMLASIVKRVSGQSLPAFANANIFEPLGMTHTHFHDDPTMIVPNRASGYFRHAGAWRVSSTGFVGGSIGNSGLQTTARDLLRWQQNFADVRVGDPALLAAMGAPTALTGGDTSSYGLGLQIGEHRGLRTIGHGGGDRGYGAHAVRYPDQGFAVAVVCNLDGINAAGLAQSVADIYLAGALAAPSASKAAAPPPNMSVSAEQLASKVGLYRDPSTEALLRTQVRDGKLLLMEGAGVELVPVNANRFLVSGGTITVEFVPDGTGRTQELHVIGVGPKPWVLQRQRPFTPSSTELRAFAGEYASRELEVTYTVTVRDSGLMALIPGRADVSLQPLFPDGFHPAGLVDVVKFSRDARGVVTGFTVHAGGVRSLRFDRVKR